jgi:hypothetical protein
MQLNSDPVPFMTSEWDRLLYALRLTEAELTGAELEKVKAFVLAHRRGRFVPLEILRRFGVYSD